MPYDANLVLRGKYAGAYADLVTSDTAATTLDAESGTGNAVVDLGDHGTPASGLDCAVIFHDTATGYTYVCDIIIQDSDHYNGGFENLLSFPTVFTYPREIIVEATTAFDYDDLGVDLEGVSAYVGHPIAISRKLLTVGGIGKIFVAMQAETDLYATSGDTLTSVNGGIGTQIGVSRVPYWASGLTLVRRFSTPRRYIRCSIIVTSGGDFGDVDILVTGSQHSHVDNLYR